MYHISFVKFVDCASHWLTSAMLQNYKFTMFRRIIVLKTGIRPISAETRSVPTAIAVLWATICAAASVITRYQYPQWPIMKRERVQANSNPSRSPKCKPFTFTKTKRQPITRQVCLLLRTQNRVNANANWSRTSPKDQYSKVSHRRPTNSI